MGIDRARLSKRVPVLVLPVGVQPYLTDRTARDNALHSDISVETITRQRQMLMNQGQLCSNRARRKFGHKRGSDAAQSRRLLHYATGAFDDFDDFDAAIGASGKRNLRRRVVQEQLAL
jgi:hypothetical protein